MPAPKEIPEIGQPSDPKGPEVPQENPEVIPDEYPPEQDAPEAPTEPNVI